jgi:hypothetical protein
MKKQDVLKNKLNNAVDKSSEAFIKQNITILPDLQSFIPPLAQDELQMLEDSILKEGCRDSLVVGKLQDAYLLVDGHNRYSICKKYSIDFRIEVQEFADIDAIKDWMIGNQLGKRNVTGEAKAYLRGMQYNREKQKHGGNQTSSQSVHSLKTHDRLGEHHKVSGKTIQRDENFALALNAVTGDNHELRWKILNRDIAVPKIAMERLAKESPVLLAKFGKRLAESGDFAHALQEVFPKEIKETAPESQILQNLQKALRSKDKNALLELAQNLQSIANGW